MEMVNGYVFLDLTKSNVYQKALKVLESGKPVVVKDGSGAPYYVDTMNLIGTMIVITKGGKTITINDLDVVTSVGDIQNHLYEHRITINGDDYDTNTYYMRIFIYNNSATLLTLNDLDKIILNGVIVDNVNVTKAIEEIDKVTIDDKDGIEVHSVFDNEALPNQFLIEDLTFKDVVKQIY